MNPSIPSIDDQQFAHAQVKPVSPWKWAFRIIRWATYAFALITLILLLHKAPPPPVETSPQAAARAEQKFEDAERAVASGQPATVRMDETELNSYLSSHLELSGANTAKPAWTGNQIPANDPAPTQQDVEQMRSNVRDVKIQL